VAVDAARDGVTTGDTLGLQLLVANLRNAVLCERGANAVLRGMIGRLEDTIERLLGYTECGCGEDEEGNYGECVPCQIRNET
jgi:hypothetical protein